ncbi:MAG: hypothetical protein B7Y39_12935 [Bdellovibrio sp. 28-41-41]|nr:MAG: hypothetical protein B7Y39_12935 [Bdellovibrio sp. 28-41-41]
MNKIALLLLSFTISYSHTAFSASSGEVPSQIRIFYGKGLVNSTVINDYLTTQNLDSIKDINRIGAEVALYSGSSKMFNFGLKYFLGQKTIDGATSGEHATVTQGVWQFIGRATLTRKDTHYIDFLLGAGGGSLAFLRETATSRSMLERNQYSSRIFTAGFSAGFGYKRLYFYLEAGYDHNYVGSMERTSGSLTPFEGIDMSGPYATIGIMIDGIPITP